MGEHCVSFSDQRGGFEAYLQQLYVDGGGMTAGRPRVRPLLKSARFGECGSAALRFHFLNSRTDSRFIAICHALWPDLG